MINPAQHGPLGFDSIVYAAPGLNYPALLGDFSPFTNPSLNYGTRSIDISDFADLGAGTPWPFTNATVPINGFLRVPQAPGPFPLALFAHGNHNDTENSARGYFYLCELLASHGILAATIDVNFLNGSNFGENDGRAIVHLEHVRQFVLWNSLAGHPLNGKVDTSRIMIVGHSRGGEAVGHASLFNRLNQVQPDPGSPNVPIDGSAGLGPYHFSLKSIIAIAPTDHQYQPVSGPTRVADNYLIIHGSRDGDVVNFPGYLTYDRSHPIDLANPTACPDGYKALVWIFRANHNFFNSVWAQESPNPTLTRGEQELIARTYIGSIAQAELLEQTDFRALLKDHREAYINGWLPRNLHFVSQYQDRNRLFIQHFNEGGANLAVSVPVQGNISTTVPLTAAKLRFNLGPSSHLYQDANGARLAWSGVNGVYRIQVTTGTLSTSSFAFLALRIGQSSEPANPDGGSQDFTLVMGDGTQSVAFPLSQFGEMLYPDTMPVGTAPKTIMQSIRIPFKFLRVQGLDLNNVVRIELKANLTASGIIYLNDLQVTQ